MLSMSSARFLFLRPDRLKRSVALLFTTGYGGLAVVLEVREGCNAFLFLRPVRLKRSVVLSVLLLPETGYGGAIVVPEVAEDG